MTRQERKSLYKTVPGVYAVIGDLDGQQHPSFGKREDAEQYVAEQGGVGFRVIYQGDQEVPRHSADLLPGGRIEKHYRY